jgi:hypothetical protein
MPPSPPLWYIFNIAMTYGFEVGKSPSIYDKSNETNFTSFDLYDLITTLAAQAQTICSTDPDVESEELCDAIGLTLAKNLDLIDDPNTTPEDIINLAKEALNG